MTTTLIDLIQQTIRNNWDPEEIEDKLNSMLMVAEITALMALSTARPAAKQRVTT